jgi:hypothetical protein
MEADFMDEAGRHIPAEFENKGFIARWLKKIRKA